MEKIIYKTSMDRQAIAWTLFFFVILGAVFFVALFMSGASTVKPMLIFIGGTTILVLLTQIKHYEITNDTFIIKRPLSSIKIPFSEIMRIEKGDNIRFDLKHTFKQFGNGGVFGYWGTFYSDLLQDFDFYSKNRNNPVVLFIKNKNKIVVSADDAGMFEELEKALKVNH